MPEHRSDCRFGPGFYRIVLEGGARRFCQTEDEVRVALKLLGSDGVQRVQRDACLDAPDGDAATSDVIDAASWLGMDRLEAMAELGLESEADYVRAYRMVEEAVLARDRHKSSGVRVPVVIKRPGVKVSDV